MSAISSVSHKENFPVASYLLPTQIRHAIVTIYQFARSADNLADEGGQCARTRLAALALYRQGLDRIVRNTRATQPLFTQLANVITDYALPIQPFYDLLDAFCQDIHTHRYAHFASLLNYCQRSANPIGRLLLGLHGITEHSNRSTHVLPPYTKIIEWSDAICTGLQLANFCQDIAIDWQKKRIYIPLDELNAAKITITGFSQIESHTHWPALMEYQINRARAYLQSGSSLIQALQSCTATRRLSWELRLVVAGGLRILECIKKNNYRVFSQRPTLNIYDWLRVIQRGIFLHQYLRSYPILPTSLHFEPITAKHQHNEPIK